MIGAACRDGGLAESEVRDCCANAIASWSLRDKRVLLVVPDHTRSAPIDVLFKILYDLIAPRAAGLGVIVALGTHPPMSDDAIDRRLGITRWEREHTYSRTRFWNHDFRNPAGLASIGVLGEDEIERLSGGRMRE